MQRENRRKRGTVLGDAMQADLMLLSEEPFRSYLCTHPCMALHCTQTLVGNKGIMPWICLWKNVKILALHREHILGKATKWREFVNTSETKTSEGLAAEYIFKHVD